MNPKRISLIYLVVQSLAFIGYVVFFTRKQEPLAFLFVLAIPFYLAAVTYTIFIHPVACLAFLIKRIKRKEKKADVILHLTWSTTLACAWWLMILNGYYLSV